MNRRIDAPAGPVRGLSPGANYRKCEAGLSCGMLQIRVTREQIFSLLPVIPRDIDEMACLFAIDPQFPLSVLMGIVPIKQGMQGHIRFVRGRIIVGNAQNVASRTIVYLAVRSQ